jgi:hypothetical protein
VDLFSKPIEAYKSAHLRRLHVLEMKTILLEMMQTEAMVDTINFIDNNPPATSKTIASLVDKAVQ